MVEGVVAVPFRVCFVFGGRVPVVGPTVGDGAGAGVPVSDGAVLLAIVLFGAVVLGAVVEELVVVSFGPVVVSAVEDEVVVSGGGAGALVVVGMAETVGAVVDVPVPVVLVAIEVLIEVLVAEDPLCAIWAQAGEPHTSVGPAKVRAMGRVRVRDLLCRAARRPRRATPLFDI